MKRFFIYGGGAAAPGPSFDAGRSVDFNGSDEYLANTTKQSYGFGNEWSFAIWWKQLGNETTNDRITAFGTDAATGDSAIVFSHMGAVASDPVRVELYDAAGFVFKQYDWYALPVSGEWGMTSVTWDGSSLRLWHNGYEQLPDATPTDGSPIGSPSDVSTRTLYVGSASGAADPFEGRIHSLGFWNKAIADAGHKTLYNSGVGKSVDWSTVSGANLQHWWRLGYNTSDIGGDYAGSIDIDANAQNIDETDVVSDAPDAAVFIEDKYCIDFDGSTEYLSNQDGQAIGIGNTWTLGVWWKPNATAYGQSNRVFSMRVEGSPNNLSILDLRGLTTNDPVQIILNDSAGSRIKTYNYDSVSTQDAWNFSVVTWDGTTLTYYHDGTVQTPSSTPDDNSGTQTDDTSRTVYIGAGSTGIIPFSGRVHSVGLWNAVLTSGNQATLYSGGSTADWTTVSGSNLQHWWRVALDRNDIGADHGVGTAVDMMTDAASISTADIVKDAP